MLLNNSDKNGKNIYSKYTHYIQYHLRNHLCTPVNER